MSYTTFFYLRERKSWVGSADWGSTSELQQPAPNLTHHRRPHCQSPYPSLQLVCFPGGGPAINCQFGQNRAMAESSHERIKTEHPSSMPINIMVVGALDDLERCQVRRMSSRACALAADQRWFLLNSNDAQT